MKSLFSFIFGLAAVSGFSQMTVNTVNVVTNDLVYDSVTNRIYATIPSANGSNGNSIGIINPDIHTLENTVFIGSEPTVMAISDNGQYIYAGFSAASTVRKFDVATQTAGQLFPLGADNFLGPYYADDIEVMPGQPNVIAVARKYVGVSPRFAAVAIYDNGVVRPTVADWWGSGEISNNIEFRDNTTLYGYDSETTAYSFNILTANSSGVSLTSGTGMPQIGWFSGVGDFAYSNNQCFFPNGQVVDVSGAPFVAGAFTNVFGPVAIDAGNNLACFAYGESGSISFKRYNIGNFLLYNSQNITQAAGTPKKTICLGNGRYAFNTENKVVILNDPNLAVESVSPQVASVYPNPATDHVRISGADISEAALYDLAGKVVLRPENTDMIDVSALDSGMYLLKATDTSHQPHVWKIVKN